MKLKSRYWYRPGTAPVLSVPKAVDAALDTGQYGAGELETLRLQMNDTRTFLSVLVGILHENGAIKDHEVLNLLPSYERVEET